MILLFCYWDSGKQAVRQVSPSQEKVGSGHRTAWPSQTMVNRLHSQ